MKRLLLACVVVFMPGLVFAANFVELCESNNPKIAHTRDVIARAVQHQGDCTDLYLLIRYITELDVAYEEIADISLIGALPDLQILNISGVRAKSLAPLKNLKNLRDLTILSRNVSNLSMLSDLVNLERLFIDDTRVRNLNFLRRLKKLTYLHFDRAVALKDVSALGELTQLEELTLGGFKARDVSVIKHLTNLKSLDLSSKKLNNPVFLQGLTQLENLLLGGKNLNLDVVANFPKLKYLHVEHSGVRDISALKDLLNLQEVYLGDNKITDLSPLEKLTNIHTLRISANPYKDISPLKGLQQISHLQAGTGTIKANKQHCPYGPELNRELDKFCRRYLGVK